MKKANSESIWRTILFSLMSIMLVFSAVSPSLAVAADEVVTVVKSDEKFSTVKKINEDGFTLSLTLDNEKKWASDITNNELKEKILINGIVADQEKSKWNDYKENIEITTNLDNSILELKFPKSEGYKPIENQTITIDVNPVLLEKWSGKVTPLSFPIYANSQISLDGSIMKNTALEDIQKGGKVIELRLLNAKWNEEYIKLTPNFNTLLDRFGAIETKPNEAPELVKWDVTQALKNTDPNKVISYSEDKRTLIIKLPSVKSKHSGDINIENSSLNDFYTVESINAEGILIDGVTGVTLGNDIIEARETPLGFKIDNPPVLNITGSVNEIDLRKAIPPSTLKLQLENANWSSLSIEKKMLLLDSIQAKDQKDQWELIKRNLSANNVNKISDSTIQITFSQEKNLRLIKDMALTLSIPYQLLEKDVKIPTQQFTIKAQPKVLLTGTAVPTISQTDFANGEKTLVLTLVNAFWQNDVGTSTKKREEILRAFAWDKSIEDEILAKADVQRTNSTTVTIKLRSVSKKYSGIISFTSEKLTNKVPDKPQNEKLLNDESEFLSDTGSFKVEAITNQSATITGTATNKINDFDIVKGEKTIIISLKNDKWKHNLEDIYIDKPIVLSTASATNKKEIKYTLERTNDTTATLKLEANIDFVLTDDLDIDITIPEHLLSVRTTPQESLKVASAFKISAVTATLSGTGISLEPIDVQKGNKSVVVTLSNAEFKDELNAEDVNKIFGTSSPWSFNDSDFVIAKNKLTIKFPAVPNYSVSNKQSFDLVINSSMLKDYSEISPEVVKSIKDGKISIGGTASANLNQTSLTESDIQSGNRSLTITLTNAEWDKTIETNASKKSALLKGFAVADQTKEWGVATSAMAKEGKFSVGDDGMTLTIQLPKNPNYSIVREQNIVLTVPKSVLKNYKYDILVNQNLLIKVPSIQSATSFSEVLGSSLLDYIEQNKMENIRVTVPKKVIQKVSTYSAQLGNNTITTIEVDTDASAKKAVVTIQSEDGKIERDSVDKKDNKFTFLLNNVQPNSTLQVEVFNESDERIGFSFNKMVKGNKVFSEVPKTPLEGNYSLYSLLTDKSLLPNIQKYYSLDELKIGTVN